LLLFDEFSNASNCFSYITATASFPVAPPTDGWSVIFVASLLILPNALVESSCREHASASALRALSSRGGRYSMHLWILLTFLSYCQIWYYFGAGGAVHVDWIYESSRINCPWCCGERIFERCRSPTHSPKESSNSFSSALVFILISLDSFSVGIPAAVNLAWLSRSIKYHRNTYHCLSTEIRHLW